MSKSITQKALMGLKVRANYIYENIELIKAIKSEETVNDTLAVTNEIEVLISAYERQIELNKKQNIKIRNQKALLRVLQQKAGVEKRKSKYLNHTNIRNSVFQDV